WSLWPGKPSPARPPGSDATGRTNWPGPGELLPRGRARPRRTVRTSSTSECLRVRGPRFVVAALTCHLRAGELAAPGFLEPGPGAPGADLFADRGIKGGRGGLARRRRPVALGGHDLDQVLAVHRLTGLG